jgi:hypothetical protein
VGFCFGGWIGFFGVVRIGGCDCPRVLLLRVYIHFSAISFWPFFLEIPSCFYLYVRIISPIWILSYFYLIGGRLGSAHYTFTY